MISEDIKNIMNWNTAQENTYLIWSVEHSCWWKPGGWGYTPALLDAGHFSREQAMQICRDALPSAPHIGKISEVPVRLSDLHDFMKGQSIPEAVLRGG